MSFIGTVLLLYFIIHFKALVSQSLGASCRQTGRRFLEKKYESLYCFSFLGCGRVRRESFQDKDVCLRLKKTVSKMAFSLSLQVHFFCLFVCSPPQQQPRLTFRVQSAPRVTEVPEDVNSTQQFGHVSPDAAYDIFNVTPIRKC